MNKTDQHLINLFIVIGIFIFACVMAIAVAQGEEELNGTLEVDFQEETAVYTESHSFDMTASVPSNPCNTCIKLFKPSDCLVECEQLIINVD